MNHEILWGWLQRLAVDRHAINTIFWLSMAVIVFTTNGLPRAPDIEPAPLLQKLDRAVVSALQKANYDATDLASQELDRWINELMQRVDQDFLEWYFGYWNQTGMELNGLYHETLHLFYEGYPSAAEKFTEKIQVEFSKRVFRPRISQMELEAITRNTVNRYLQKLSQEFRLIPQQYRIPQGAWKRYLSDIAEISSDAHDDRNLFVTLKTLCASAIGSVAVFASTLPIFAGKVGASVIERLAGKVMTRIAAKTTARVMAKVSGKLVGPVLGLGIFAWDIWEHEQMKAENKPILRKLLADYLTQVKNSLLYDSKEGIISILNDMDKIIYVSLVKKS